MQMNNARLTMQELVTTLTQRSQVTLPAEVRRVLGLKPRDKVAFTIEGSDVRLVPAQFSLESAYGSVAPLRRPEDFERITREAKAEKAKKTAAPSP